MKNRTVVTFVITILALLVAGPVFAAQEGTLAFQWVGNTSVPVFHAGGHLAPNRQCQADYGLARICIVLEVLNTVDAPDVFGKARLWKGVLERGKSNNDCSAWQSTGTLPALFSLTVDGEGVFTSSGGSCEAGNLLPFACCAMIPISE